MKASDFKGIIPPIMTAFTGEGEIYEKGTREIVDFLIPYVHGLYPCGTYGCGPMMSISERKRVAEIIIDQTRGRVPVIVHVGTADTKNTIELARHAEKIGAQAVAAIVPYYNKYSEDAIFLHFQKLIDAVNIPVFLYNYPAYSGNSISSNLLVRLAKEGLGGVKDSTFDIINYYHSRIALQEFPEFNLIIGTEALLVSAFDFGAKASVAGLGNVYPELMRKFYDAYLTGNREDLKRLQEKVLVVRQITQFGPTIPTCHAILKLRGIDSGYPRLPYTQIPAETERRVKEALQKMELL
jgi:dihydrodipicolinate synthase/N-acetylneuraminate lyase